MGQGLIHLEFSSDKDFALAHWYRDVLGWKLTEFPDMHYAAGTFTEDSAVPGVGFTQMDDAWPRGTIIPYFYTEDIDADIARLAAAGAQHFGEVLDVPGVGKMTYFKDPRENTIALLQPVMPTA